MVELVIGLVVALVVVSLIVSMAVCVNSGRFSEEEREAEFKKACESAIEILNRRNSDISKED